jgi:hypothetical protein
MPLRRCHGESCRDRYPRRGCRSRPGVLGPDLPQQLGADLAGGQLPDLESGIPDPVSDDPGPEHAGEEAPLTVSEQAAL